MTIEIQARDLQLMKFVFACRVVTYDQIARRHFSKTHKTAAWRRIRKLQKAGFVKPGVLELGGKIQRMVQPLPKIWTAIGEKWPVTIENPLFKSESPEHDIRLAEVLLSLERLKGFRSFFTENLLQSSTALANDPRFRDLAKNHADGGLTLEDERGSLKTYGVEFELSKKSLEGYRDKLLDYYLAQGIDGVFYICSNPGIKTLLARADAEIGKDRRPIVWFADESSVHSGSNEITFSNHREQTLVIR